MKSIISFLQKHPAFSRTLLLAITTFCLSIFTCAIFGLSPGATMYRIATGAAGLAVSCLLVIHYRVQIKYMMSWWPGTWAGPLAIGGILISPVLLRWMDPTSAIFDLGYLQVFVYAALGIVLANELAFLGIKHNFPKLFNDYKQWQSSHQIGSEAPISASQRAWLLFGLYALCMLCFVLLVIAFA